jgi:OmpA-OmpF porin, OOP family
MNKYLFTALLFAAPLLLQAQIGNVLNRAKAKVNQRVNNKIDKGIDEALDEVEGKGKPKPAANNSADGTASSSNKKIGYASTFDFIPGEQLLYTEDFSQDAVGELPLNWNTTGKAEVVTVDGQNGKWVKMYQNSFYLTGNKKEFPKNFTVEFDLLLAFNYKSYTLPLVTFGLLASNDLSTTENELMTNHSKFQSTEVMLRPGYKSTPSYAMVKSFVERKDFYKSADQELDGFDANYNEVIHIAMQVQESRLRIWINSDKVFDIPKGMPIQYIFNQLFFKIHSSGYKENEIGFYLSNIKVATGVPDTRHKLMEEGTFSTTGILFNVNEATLQPASYGVIREIAAVLKANPSVRISITGHTDSDGADAANLTLSQRRAVTVKDVLVNEFSIDAARMETDGKGESKPVADNKTKEGKAANRRVEFTKL